MRRVVSDDHSGVREVLCEGCLDERHVLAMKGLGVRRAEAASLPVHDDADAPVVVHAMLSRSFGYDRVPEQAKICPEGRPDEAHAGDHDATGIQQVNSQLIGEYAAFLAARHHVAAAVVLVISGHDDDRFALQRTVSLLSQPSDRIADRLPGVTGKYRDIEGQVPRKTEVLEFQMEIAQDEQSHINFLSRGGAGMGPCRQQGVHRQTRLPS
ncbi:hypothetical protein BOSE62_71322 [Bosea sp. 62]|nr:hypothetical protein BOSE21B_90308 [Bosea sp. 21B]CAD5295502.1 hypothetical protein BOSE46_80401 [Bosea sp. 46]VVT60953.1 hypothetical protein BOS5A_230230 [Bosea sp. EC-HK365B]VXB34964.1 hypothetical protein BOSE127_110356 [Bosea sp. 127]VXB58594.1 hypothetical protein BOSE125_131148 [Bosea sp. 125]VXC76726.1 hypothetical protein BOSE29B_80291 [Bosea sp. 29B]VXC90010.1 hypothetical protein BOSE62_71322 [Bosea sp. 62]